MNSKINISIKKPCSENFNNFQNTTKGGYCSSCKKEVTDFTAMTDQDAASDKQGAGLALSVSWEMTQRMNGRISVDAAVDGGTVFCVSLPYQHNG